MLHSQGREDACLQALIPQPSVQLLDDLAEDTEAKVAVVKVSAGGKPLHMRRRGIALKERGCVGEARGVRQ